MSEHRIIRHPRKSSRCRVALLLASVTIWSLTGACQMVIGDLPLKTDPVSDGGPLDPHDRAPADVSVDAGREDVAADSAVDSADAGVGDADGAVPDGDAADADSIDTGPCTSAVAWYPDIDGDGYGRSDGMVMACPKPSGKWARISGDCNDENGFVHPGQTTYFGTPFSQDGKDSFDYNCAAGEEGDPLQQKAPPNCGLLSLALCEGQGYAITPRTGIGINPYCGSRVSTTCRAALAILICEGVSEEVDSPYRCR
jgi:hypothetical protein